MSSLTRHLTALRATGYANYRNHFNAFLSPYPSSFTDASTHAPSFQLPSIAELSLDQPITGTIQIMLPFRGSPSRHCKTNYPSGWTHVLSHLTRASLLHFHLPEVRSHSSTLPSNRLPHHRPSLWMPLNSTWAKPLTASSGTFFSKWRYQVLPKRLVAWGSVLFQTLLARLGSSSVSE